MTAQQAVDGVSAAPTAIGTFDRVLKNVPLAPLGTTAVKVKRSSVRPDQVDHPLMGNVILTEPRDAYLSRVAAIEAGLRKAPTFSINRLCSSGFRAIVSAAKSPLLGDAEVTIGRGVESITSSERV